MTDIVQILTDAKALIDTPEKWTKGWFARSANNRRVRQGSNKACRWCVVGAVGVASGSSGSCAARALAALRECCSEDFIADFNDDPATTHADIMALFDRAIARAREAA